MTSSSSPGHLPEERGPHLTSPAATFPPSWSTSSAAARAWAASSRRQSDYFQATRGGGHGDYHMIVLAPASVQEMAEPHRQGLRPGGQVPHDRHDPGRRHHGPDDGARLPWRTCEIERLRQALGRHRHRRCKRKHNIVNSLYLEPDELEQQNFERYEQYARSMEENEVMYEELSDGRRRDLRGGLRHRRPRGQERRRRGRASEGIKVGLIRPITLWPFPKTGSGAAADQVQDASCRVELSMGQMIEDVELATQLPAARSTCATGWAA